MISGWTLFGAVVILGVMICILACCKVSSDISREEEADEWEREHAKERDGSGV